MTVRRAATTLGEQFRTQRVALGMTAAELADRAGVSRLALRKIETGDAGVRFENVLDVARTLGLLRALVALTEPPTAEVVRSRVVQPVRRRIG